MYFSTGLELRIVFRFFVGSVFAPFSLHFLLHFRSKCDPYHCRFWVTFGLLLCHFWITLEHKVTASRSWALGARCEDYPSCRAHFARRAGTPRRMGHAHFARWAGTTCRIWHADFVRRAGTTRRIVHALFLPSGDYRTPRHIGHAHFARRAGTTRRIGHALSARRAGTTRHVALTILTHRSLPLDNP